MPSAHPTAGLPFHWKSKDLVRSKTDLAIRNEVLAKVLCHNVVVVIHEMHELGISPGFRAGDEPAPNIIRFPGACITRNRISANPQLASRILKV